MTRQEAKKVKLSPSFTLFELLQSDTADKYGIEEQYDVSEDEIEKLRQLAIHVLQPLRDHIGRPLMVSSGYRCPQVNTLIGGSSRSDHMYFRAADIQLHLGDGQTDNKAIFTAVLDLEIPFKQMIWEYGTDQEPKWVHIAWDISGGNASDNILKASRVSGRTQYTRMQPRKPREGWVSAAYIKYRAEAADDGESLANNWPIKVKLFAIGAAASGLKIRKTPVDGQTIDILDYEEEMRIIDIKANWVKIKIEDE